MDAGLRSLIVPLVLGIALVGFMVWSRALGRRVRARSRHLRRLNAIVEAINQPMALDELLTAILRESRFIEGVETASVLALDPERSLFRVIASTEWSGAVNPYGAVELTAEEAEARYTQGAVVLAEDIFLIEETGGRCAEEKVRAMGISQSMLVLRVLVEGRPVGYLIYNNLHDPGAIQIHDLDLLKGLKGHLTSAFLKARNVELLAEAKARAEQAARFKSEFLASMSHEIRTPMNAVLGFARLGQKLDLPPKAHDYFRKIADAGNALLEIINDVLDLSKIEAGKMELEEVPFDPARVLREVLALFTQKAAEKDLELILVADPSLPGELVGDPVRLGQVLVNLVGNAIKFTSSGFIRIQAEADEPAAGGARLTFRVQDSGIGMTAEQQERLFQEFSQGGHDIARTYGGTGLGLAIAKRLVERMGGEIRVESAPGSGSLFTFTCRFGCRQRTSRPIRVPESLRGACVLVVDDNAMARESLTEMLELLGFAAAGAESGEQALEVLRRDGQRIRLVLMDWKMPGMDGLETFRRIRTDADLAPGPPVIMVTAFGREDVALAAEASGARGFLMKPVEPPLLLAAALEALGQPGGPPQGPEEAEPIRDGARLRGARVLVVDDNPINQQVAQGILATAGVVSDAASSAAEALGLIERSAYDAVFMDIQMPGKDGFQATAELRREPRFRDLPVLAMTAHALEGDRERCLAAGMNGYVSKPVEPAALFASLAAVLPERRPAGPGLAVPVAAPLPDRLPGLDIPLALRRLGGNAELFRQVARAFGEQSGAVQDQLLGALGQGDWEGAARILHTLKGTSGNLSAQGLYTAVTRCEQAVRDREAGRLPGLLEELGRELGLVLASCRSLAAPEAPPPVRRTLGLAELQPLLVRLAEEIRMSSPDAEYPLGELKEALAGDGLEPRLLAVEERIRAFDYHGAGRELEQLVRGLGR